MPQQSAGCVLVGGPQLVAALERLAVGREVARQRQRRADCDRALRCRARAGAGAAAATAATRSAGREQDRRGHRQAGCQMTPVEHATPPHLASLRSGQTRARRATGRRHRGSRAPAPGPAIVCGKVPPCSSAVNGNRMQLARCQSSRRRPGATTPARSRRCQSPYERPITSSMISSVPAPIRFSRRSRHERSIPYSFM